MKTIEIRIPELGKLAGTTAWVAPLLEKINNSLKAENTKSNLPCLTYEHPFHVNKEGKAKRYIFCVAKPSRNNYELWKAFMFLNRDAYMDDVMCVYAVDSDYESGLFTYLTDAAQDAVQNYIDSVVKEFSKTLKTL